MRLLCTGDIHLGRNPTRIPSDLVPDQSPFSTRAIWTRIVDLAIEERVDALLISGDLVDRANRFFEALGPVEAGIEQLRDAGIPVVAVAGNHDFDVLPRLADRYGDAFRLLGRHQQWERHTIADARGKTLLHIDGWSFAWPHTTVDPMATYRFETPEDAPVVGLLHCDLDQTTSQYAPVRLADLHASSVAAWLIGHVHKPAHLQVSGGPPVLYPGSPTPLDPGEPGEHGVWLLELKPGAPAQFTSRPIASLAYDSVTIDLTGVTDLIEAGSRIFDKLVAVSDASAARYQLFRVKVVGRVNLGSRRDGRFREIAELHSERWSIESLIDRTRPEVDLHALALETSPPGALARMLLSLESAQTEPPILASARNAIEAEAANSVYSQVRDVELPNAESVLSETAWHLLETLLAQPGAAS